MQPYLPIAIAVFFYLEFVWGGAPPSLSSGACHTLATVTSLPLSKHSRGGGTTPAFPCQLGYLQFRERLPLPQSPELRAPHPLCYVSFFFSTACLLFSLFFFSFYSLDRGSVCPGCYADLFQGSLCEYHMPLSSPCVLCLLSRVGTGIWWPGGPPGFSV
jgi:hypothetical protein